MKRRNRWRSPAVSPGAGTVLFSYLEQLSTPPQRPNHPEEASTHQQPGAGIRDGQQPAAVRQVSFQHRGSSRSTRSR